MICSIIRVAYATQRGLTFVDLTTDPDNLASQKVIEACNGVLVERYRREAAFGSAEALRFRVHLDEVEANKV